MWKSGALLCAQLATNADLLVENAPEELSITLVYG
jgi:hypothetical protein